MKENKEKKQKKPFPQPLPVWSGGEAKTQQISLALLLNIAVRLALLCMATAGVVLMFVQLYDVPVNTGLVILCTVLTMLFFNVLFMFIKFRYALPALGVVLFIYIRAGEVLYNLGCLADYLLIHIDGGMLHTAGYASRPVTAVTRMTLDFQASLQAAVIFCAVIFTLLFAVSARGKFIGVILITSIILVIPAIASQKASYVPAFTLLACSMLGLYSIWASQEQNFLKSISARKKKKPPYIPQIHRHSVNGAAAACLALIAVMTAQALLPVHRARDIIDFWSRATDNVIIFFHDIGDLIGGGLSGWDGFSGLGAAPLDTSGYMPGGGINASGSLSISNPTISKRPALNVMLDDSLSPVYLRNGIGSSYDAVRERWNVDGRTNHMRGFPDSFYPEHEYLVFRQKVSNLGFAADLLIGRQRVDIEYLVRTPHVMLPTSPYLPGYKSDPRFNWRNDVILEKRGSNNPQTYTWDVFYPMHSAHLGYAISDIERITGERALSGAEASMYSIAGSFEDYIYLSFSDDGGGETEGALRIFVNDYGLSAAEYLHYLAQYEEMVYSVYLEVTPGEAENIQRILTEVPLYPVSLRGTDSRRGISDYQRAVTIENFFKTNFTYSLTVDNHSGENSYLGNFLFETQSGHCALYATAMTLMLRELGIPARYVTGFVAGGINAVPHGGRYLHTILERDLHAWVEVYFEGVGWIPFDPTPPIQEYHFIEAQNAENSEQPRITTTTQVTEVPVTITTPTITTLPAITPGTPEELPPPDGGELPETPPASLKRNNTAFMLQIVMVFAIVLLFMGLVAAVVMFLKGVRRSERRRLARYADLNDDIIAREVYRFILKLLKMEGFTAAAGETPRKFAARVDEGLSAGTLTPVINAALKLEFSREELTAVEYAGLSEAVQSLYSQVVTEKKKFKRLARRIIALDIIK
ncbi:MAG: transglutaminase-like domain-containing protein [Oscillospiraceae bacterium]|nr:transglutaminase-like domain-containing protein [Oscillospiraceae bacterium]